MVTEYIYFDYVPDEHLDTSSLVISHTARNDPDKYAEQMPCVVLYGEEDLVDFILDSLDLK
jgi:hypothetical protein